MDRYLIHVDNNFGIGCQPSGYYPEKRLSNIILRRDTEICNCHAQMHFQFFPLTVFVTLYHCVACALHMPSPYVYNCCRCISIHKYNVVVAVKYIYI